MTKNEIIDAGITSKGENLIDEKKNKLNKSVVRFSKFNDGDWIASPWPLNKLRKNTMFNIEGKIINIDIDIFFILSLTCISSAKGIKIIDIINNTEGIICK